MLLTGAWTHCCKMQRTRQAGARTGHKDAMACSSYCSWVHQWAAIYLSCLACRDMEHAGPVQLALLGIVTMLLADCYCPALN